jgi:putative oxidoreductase
MLNLIRNYWKQLPDFSLSHILLRIPLAIVFIQQGFNKLPFDPAVGEGFGLPALVWWVVIYGELGAGIGLLVGAVTTIHLIRDIPFVAEVGDLITRMSGITMCCITTGIIWVVTKPESLQQVILYDNFHVFLWAGGLYFALRGNWAVAVNKQLVAKKA